MPAMPGDGALDRLGDLVVDDARARRRCSRSMTDDHGGIDVRQLAHRQPQQRGDAEHHDQHAEHGREHRPLDAEVGQRHGCALARSRIRSAGAADLTGAPSRSRCRPLATIALAGREAGHASRPAPSIALAELDVAPRARPSCGREHEGRQAFGQHRLLRDRSAPSRSARISSTCRNMPAGKVRSGLGSTARTRNERATLSTRLSIVATLPTKRRSPKATPDALTVWPALDLAVRRSPARELDLDLAQIVERGQHGVVVDPGADVDLAQPDDAAERRPHGAVGEQAHAPRRAAPARRRARPPDRRPWPGRRCCCCAASPPARRPAPPRAASRAPRPTSACWISSSRRTRTSPAATRWPGANVMLTTRPEASGTMSTACLARVVPTASIRRRSVSCCAGATSTGTACGPRCTAASAPDSGSLRQMEQGAAAEERPARPRAAASCLTSDTCAIPYLYREFLPQSDYNDAGRRAASRVTRSGTPSSRRRALRQQARGAQPARCCLKNSIVRDQASSAAALS